MDLEILEASAASCECCELHKGRNKAVFARGNPQSKLMICGMVPGPEENKVGSPFIGRAGIMLDNIIRAADIDQNEVYITNAVKCALKPGIPLKEEWIGACLSYLLAQIFVIQPKVIITLGADASNALLGQPLDTKIGNMRGKPHKYADNMYVIPTYHPSYIVRGGGVKHKHYDRVVGDFELAMMILNDENVQIAS